jgi:uncharacterized membrane protein
MGEIRHLDPERRRKKVASSVRSNIETVARLEEGMQSQRTRIERFGDAVADFAGSMGFILAHAAAFILWIVVNSGKIPGLPVFDPYPYVFLTMIVSMEAVLVSTFVLMKQNRMSRRADRREHLDLQVNLLAEKEITKMLQLQKKICDHLGIPQIQDDGEVQELSQDTAVDHLAEELRNKLPDT